MTDLVRVSFNDTFLVPFRPFWNTRSKDKAVFKSEKEKEEQQQATTSNNKQQQATTGSNSKNNQQQQPKNPTTMVLFHRVSHRLFKPSFSTAAQPHSLTARCSCEDFDPGGAAAGALVEGDTRSDESTGRVENLWKMGWKGGSIV